MFRGPCIALLILLLAGCATDPAQPALGRPEPVEGWTNYETIYRTGAFYIGGRPTEPGLQRAADAGVTTVIDLGATDLGFDEAAVVEGLGMRYERVPVKSDTFSGADVDRVAEIIAAADGPVLIHCNSSNRAGAMWASYLYRYREANREDAMSAGIAAGMRKPVVIESAERVMTEPRQVKVPLEID